ncbi:MAG: hypothetical protein AAF368_18450 [Planctomycetota bacterium]
MGELVERLEGEGFEVKLFRDQQGVLRGISFGQGEARFKGSQLGKRFTHCCPTNFAK